MGQGVYVNSGGSIANAGTIVSYANTGVGVHLEGSLRNPVGGVISAMGGNGAIGVGMAGDLENAGTIRASTCGVRLASESSVTNDSGGKITAGHWGIYVVNENYPVQIVNNGLVSATGANGVGIYIEDRDLTGPAPGFMSTNRAAGIVSGTIDGIREAPNAPRPVTNAGVITGGDRGVVFAKAGTVTNLAGGQIAATGATGVGVEFDSGGVLVNQAGGVIAATYGVEIKGAAGCNSPTPGRLTASSVPSPSLAAARIP